MKRTIHRWIRIAAVAAFATVLPAAAAETSEVRLAKQFSMGYVQFNMMERHKLIEKHAKAAGLGDIKVTWATFNGPNHMNDALLSGNVDFVSGGVPGLITLWAKTRNTPLEVRGVTAFSSQPFFLNTRNPAIKSLRDFTPKDRIALPAVKVSVQAVTLQMAAAKEFGEAQFGRLDAQTVSMSPPDATTGLLSGTGDFTSVFSVPPFQYQQLDQPGIRTVLNSFEVMGGPHTFTVAWTSRKFREQNPRVYRAVLAAFQEATELINADKRAAAQSWAEDTKSKISVDQVHRILSGPQVEWTMTPNNTMKYAAFMHKVGSIQTPPTSWKDLFFPEIHHLAGS
jgi:NitT/TauT family transport system substrate-binding protein